MTMDKPVKSMDATAKGKHMAKLIRERIEANRAAYDRAFANVVMSAKEREALAAEEATKRKPKGSA